MIDSLTEQLTGCLLLDNWLRTEILIVTTDCRPASVWLTFDNQIDSRTCWLTELLTNRLIGKLFKAVSLKKVDV